MLIDFICKHGHKRSEVGCSIDSGCRKCAKDRAAKYRLDNPEKAKEAKHKCYKEKQKIYCSKNRKWAMAHKKRNNLHKAKWKTINPNYERSRQYKNFGITIEQFDKMMALQNGGCALCGRLPGKKRLSVEHDHKTGRVRGLACFRCNKFLIGRWGEKDIPLIEKLIEYLRSAFDGRNI